MSWRARNPLLANQGRTPRALVWVGNLAGLSGLQTLPFLKPLSPPRVAREGEEAREQQRGPCGLRRHLSPEVKPVQGENVSGDDVEDGRRATQVLLIFKTELFLSLQYGCSARHDISQPLPSRPPLLPLVLPPAEGRLMEAMQALVRG